MTEVQIRGWKKGMPKHAGFFLFALQPLKQSAPVTQVIGRVEPSPLVWDRGALKVTFFGPEQYPLNLVYNGFHKEIVLPEVPQEVIRECLAMLESLRLEFKV